jgi:predicted enzyme involved in methoxymalonyl-ACP biosynthesis
VEQLAVNKIFEFARRGNYESVVGHYIPTAKNVMVKNFFEQFGFHRLQTSGDGTTEWQLEANQYTPRTVFIQESSAELFTTPLEVTP